MDRLDRTIETTLALAVPRPGLTEEVLTALRHLGAVPLADDGHGRRLGRWLVASTVAGVGAGLAGVTLFELSRRKRAQ